MNFKQKCFYMGLVLVPFLVIGCSSDIEEEPEERDILRPLVPPKPDWVDGTITIEVGQYKTGPQMLNELRRQRINLGIFVDDGLLNPNFPISGRKYSVEVTVVTMFEVGINEPASYTDTYKRYLERGYRPLTPEEAVTLRLQFKDQPKMSTGNKMARFFVLMDPSVITTYHRHTGEYYTMGCEKSCGIGTRSPDTILDPATGGVHTYDPPGAMPEIRFAVVKK